MANQSEREDREEILSGSGLSEGHNWGEVMAGTIATQPPYSDDELMDMVQIIVYCFGFLSNISAIVVFFKEGLSTSSHIGFVSLALADLSVCTFCLIDSIGDWILHDYEFLQEFWWTIKLEENSATFSAWIVAVICWERLCEITFPEKVIERLMASDRVILFVNFDEKMAVSNVECIIGNTALPYNYSLFKLVE